MSSKKPEQGTSDSVIAAVDDSQLADAAAEYRAATTNLYNLLLKDNDGEPIAALGALSLFRIKCEQSILDQVRGYARAARRRSGGRGRRRGT